MFLPRKLSLADLCLHFLVTLNIAAGAVVGPSAQGAGHVGHHQKGTDAHRKHHGAVMLASVQEPLLADTQDKTFNPDMIQYTYQTWNGSDYRIVPIEHYSFGGPLAKLNHLSRYTFVQLDCKFAEDRNITGWRFWAESRLPFYASVWRLIKEDYTNKEFLLQLVGANRISPTGTAGFQEVHVPRKERVVAKAGDVFGVFYVEADSSLPQFHKDDGTVPMEKASGDPTQLGYKVTTYKSTYFKRSDNPYLVGDQVATKKVTELALAINPVSEPDCRFRPIPPEMRRFGDLEGITQGFFEVNKGRLWGGICETRTDMQEVAKEWGNYACRRANNNDPQFEMVYFYTEDASAVKMTPPLAEPILQNPKCIANPYQMFATGCEDTVKCNLRHTPVVICWHKAHKSRIIASITSSNHWGQSVW